MSKADTFTSQPCEKQKKPPLQCRESTPSTYFSIINQLHKIWFNGSGNFIGPSCQRILHLHLLHCLFKGSSHYLVLDISRHFRYPT